MSQLALATGSIGRRLTLLLAGIAALLSLLSWGMVTGLAREAAERTQDNVLAASATAIAETLRTESGDVRLELPYAAFSMLDAIGEDRVFYLVTAGDRTLTGYADLPVQTVSLPGPGRVAFDTGVYRGDEIRMASLTRHILTGSTPLAVTVTVAQTRYGVGQIAGEVSRLAAVLSVAFFIVAVALSFFAVRTSLRPVTAIAEAVARRGPSDLRPLRRPTPSELVPLVASLDRLMDRLGQSIRRSEEFIAEAAHRVRTPLATVRTQAEIALRSIEDETERQRLRRMIRAVDESSRSAGQLLDHATVAFRAEHLAQDEVDLGDLVRTTVASVAPTAAMRDIDMEMTFEVEAKVRGDAVLLESALRNVIDNAIKYSPAETVIRVTVARQDRQVAMTVRDEGPGLGPGPLENLTKRFQRGQNAEGVVGSGLGLTIADDVLRVHGGWLALGSCEEGEGACVSLVLPCP